MPVIITPDQTQTTRSGEGWQEITLADSRMTGTSAMIARRWTINPGVQTPQNTHGDTDQLLYVMRGGGKAIVDGVSYPLDHESIVWLDPGEVCHFVAGPEGLEILQGYAPGDQ